MTLLYVPPVFEGRRLKPAHRAALLMREGETWVTWDQILEKRLNGDDTPYRITALIWHGEFGTSIKGPGEHMEGG